MRRSLLLSLPLFAGLLALSGCGSLMAAATADGAGIAGAGIANSVTKDAAVATGIGLGVAAAANAGLQYAERNIHQAEQDRIATVAGTLRPGAIGQWNVEHSVPLEPDEHGNLVVVRNIGVADFACKEIVFSVDTGRAPGPDVPAAPPVGRAFYTATVCQDGQVWKWASAEPATERWGSLQ